MGRDPLIPGVDRGAGRYARAPYGKVDMDKIEDFLARIEREGSTPEAVDAVLDVAAYAPDDEALTVAEYKAMLRRLVAAGLMAVCAAPGCSIAFILRRRNHRYCSDRCRRRATPSKGARA